MVSFNDILDSGAQFQGPLCVVAISYEGKSTVAYEGEGEDVPNDEPWGEGCVGHVYYDVVYGCMTVEIEEEE